MALTQSPASFYDGYALNRASGYGALNRRAMQKRVFAAQSEGCIMQSAVMSAWPFKVRENLLHYILSRNLKHGERSNKFAAS